MRELLPYKYSDEQLIEWLRSLNPNFDDQNWHNDVVVHFSPLISLTSSICMYLS